MAGETAIGALAVRIGADASELIEAMSKGGKALDGLNKKAGDLMTVFKSFAGALSVGAMVAYVKHAADMADEAGKLAQKVGMTVEAFSSFRHAASIADLSTEQFSTGLKQLAKSMAEANQGAGDAFSTFRALGVEVSDRVGGQLKTTEATLLALAEKFSLMEDGAGKTAIAMRVFGRSGAEMIPFLNQGREGIEQLRKEAERLGIVISTEAAKRAEEFNDNLRRLKASSDGLAIALTTDLVDGLGKATGAMLKARQEGETFAAQLRAAMRVLMTGDDLHKWNVDISNAVSQLDVAQRQLIAVKAAAMSENGKANPDQASEAIERYTAKVAAATAEVKRLQAIKSTLLGPNDPDAPKTPLPPKVAAPVIEDDKTRADRLKAEIDAETMFQADSLEAWTLYYAFLQTERDKDLELVQRLRADTFAAIDAEQAYEIEAAQVTGEAVGKAHSARLVSLRDYMDAGRAAENEAHALRMEELKSFSDEELAAIGGRQEVEQRMEAEHQDRLGEIRQNEMRLEEQRRSATLQGAQTFFGAMSGLMNTQSRKMFEIGKAGAIAETIVNTYSAAMKAFDSLADIPYVGYALGAAAAAAVITAGIANVQKISATTFGSKSAGAGGTFPASPNTGLASVGAQTGQGGGRGGQTTVVHLHGERFTRKQVRELLEQFNEEGSDGGRVVIA